MWPALPGERALSHKYPDNLARARALPAQSSAPFSSRHRIRTTSGEILKVVVVGDAVTDQDGRIVAIGGFYIDITDSFITDLQDSIGEETEMIRAHREAQVSRTTTPLSGVERGLAAEPIPVAPTPPTRSNGRGLPAQPGPAG